METWRPKIPAEAIELYNRYIHGQISRRDFFEGAKRFAIAGLGATTIIEALMPNYALGQQVSKTDERIKATYETVPSPQGNGRIRGYLVRPFSADTRAENGDETTRHYRRPREPRPESPYRGHRTSVCPRELHGVCSRRTHVRRRLSGRRLQRRPVVYESRSHEDDRRFRGVRNVAEIARRLHWENRRHRFLLRWRHGQYAGCPARNGFSRRRAVLRRRSAHPGYSKDQSGDSRAPWRARHGFGDGMAGVRSGTKESQRATRGSYLSRRRSWFQ